jgi:hypothetical protein
MLIYSGSASKMVLQDGRILAGTQSTGSIRGRSDRVPLRTPPLPRGCPELPDLAVLRLRPLKVLRVTTMN